MGIWDKIKKLFVTTAETVQTTGHQVVESAQEAGRQIADTSGTILERAGVDKVGEAVIESANKTTDKAAQIAEQVGGAVLDKTNELLTNAVEGAATLKEKSGELLERAGVDKVGATILDTVQSVQDKAGELAGKVGSGILSGAAEAGKTIGETLNNVGNRMADFVEEAQRAAASEAHPSDKSEAKSAQSLSDNRQTIEVTGRVVENNSEQDNTAQVVEAEEVPPAEDAADIQGAEDFFKRAERWAKGDYS